MPKHTNPLTVYDDDTTIIPRSTTVIAKRLPAAKSGRGGAARYVSGKMPVNAKNTHRSEALATRANGRGQSTQRPNNGLNVSELQTEEEREAAVLKLAADQWEQQQQEMAGYVCDQMHALNTRYPYQSLLYL